MRTTLFGVLLVGVALSMSACVSQPGQQVKRKGDEIMVAGQMFHTGTRVILWTDPGGYDAYRVERRFAPIEESSYAATTQEVRGITTPNRYGLRQSVLTPAEIEEVRGGGWPLKLLQQKVDQFVIHYDVAGVSKECFAVLQDQRDLSVQFMCDIDGTIYQTLDLKERAWQATKANSRSVGVEVANVGAYPVGSSPAALKQWYAHDAQGKPMIKIPEALIKRLGQPIIYEGSLGKTFRPARPEMIKGEVNGKMYEQYDFTPEQYAALTKLTATLCTVLPKINCDAPRDASGKVINRVLTNEEYAKFQGVMGHWHVQRNKEDPGPAFDWDRVLKGARKLMTSRADRRNKKELGHPVTTQPAGDVVQRSMERRRNYQG